MDVKLNQLTLLTVLIFVANEVHGFEDSSPGLSLPTSSLGLTDFDRENETWLNGSCSTVTKNFKTWWRIDLKVAHKIAGVKITNRRTCCSNISDIEIKVGFYSRIPTRNKLCKHRRNTIGRGKTKIINCNPPRIGRFVFVTFRSLQRGYLSLCAVEVHAVSNGCYNSRKRNWYNFNQTFSPSNCLRCKCNTNSSITCNRSIAQMEPYRPYCKDCGMRWQAVRYACKTCFDGVNNKTYAYRKYWKLNKCSRCYCSGSGNICKIWLKNRLSLWIPTACRKCDIKAFVKRYPCTDCYSEATGKSYPHGQHWNVNGTCVSCQCIAGIANCARYAALYEVSNGTVYIRPAPICTNCSALKFSNYLRRYDCKVCYNDFANVTVMHGKEFEARGLTCACNDGILSCRKVILGDVTPSGRSLAWYCFNCSVAKSLEKFKQMGCKFQGNLLENGETRLIGFGKMPYCMKCFCFNGIIDCSYGERPDTAVKIRHCLSNASCTIAADSVSKACQRDVSLNCCTTPPSNRWWLANGCNYSCSGQKLNGTIIEKPWCQIISKNKYCAICPDKETFLQQYGDKYVFCEKEEKLIKREQICDGVVNCAKDTDEKHCLTYYCKSTFRKIKGVNFVWKRAEVKVTKILGCWHIRPHWSGDLTRTCHMNKSAGTFWADLDFCQCHDTRNDPFEIEDISNSTAVLFKTNAVKLYQYAKNIVSLGRSLELAIKLIDKAMDIEFGNERKIVSVLKSFTWNLRKILTRDMEIFCRKAEDESKRKQLDMKIREFNSKYNISNLNRNKNAGMKIWSISHSDFLQDVLFPEDNVDGTSIDSLQMNGINSKGSGLGISSTNTTNANNTSVKGVVSKVTKEKIKQIPIHIKIQLIMDIVFAMISLLALTIAVFLLFGFSVPATTKLFIHKNLFAARIISTLMYVIGSWTEKYLIRKRGICITFLILQYCSSLATFSWMLVEGINLFNVIVLVFQTKRTNHSVYAATGWGIPLFSFIITIAAQSDAFLKSSRCTSLGVIGWLFKGPVAILLGINLFIFVIILWKVTKNITSSQRLSTSPQKLRSTLRAFFTLIPVLGVAEILGFAIESSPVIIGYIYVLVNGLISLLFPVLHCFLDPQVQEAIKKFQNKRRTSTQISSQFTPRSPATSFSFSQNENEAFVHDTKL